MRHRSGRSLSSGTRGNGEIIPVSERYQIKPNILLLTAQPDDEILFAPDYFVVVDGGTEKKLDPVVDVFEQRRL